MAKDDAPNTVGDRYNQVGAAANLDEIYARTRRMSEVNTVAGERLRQEGRGVRTQLRNLKEAHSILTTPGIPRTPEIAAGLAQNRDEYAAALSERSSISQRFYEEKQVAIHRAGQSFQSQINQFTGSRQQASRINEAYSSTSSLDAAARQMNSTGYSGFESMVQGGTGRAREVAAQLREAAVNGAPEAKIRELGGQLSGAESQIGIGRRGMQLTRQAGQDPQSQFNRINDVSARAADRLGGEALKEKAAAGELPSLKELNEQIKEAAQELGALKESFAEGKKPLDDFNKEAGAVADKLTKLEAQEKAVQGAGGGRGPYDEMRGNMGVARAGIDALRATTINQPIQALNVKAQMAQAQNEQFHTIDAALHGDMSALGMLGSGAFGNAAGFARQQQLSQKILQTGEAGADILDAGAEAGLIGAKGFSLGNLGGGTVEGAGRAAQALAHGAINAGVRVSDVAQGVTAGETSVQAYQAAMNAQRTIMEVPSELRQSYFDYGKNVTAATRSAGGGREKMMGDLMDMKPGGFMSNMADMGVDPNRAAGMIAQGSAEQGSAFSTKQIGTARNLERGGYGNMEESMRRMSTLANTGGANNANDSMGKIMEEAVSKGMDSSKAISLMTDGISHLAQSGGTAASGVDGTAGITQLLGRALGQADGRSDVNRSTAAVGAINTATEALGDTSVSYTNMVRNTRFRQMGMGGIEAGAAMKLSAPELAVLQKGGKAAEQLATERGLSTFFDANGKYDKRQANKVAAEQGKFLEQGGASGLGMIQTPEDAAASHAAKIKFAKGETLTAAERKALMHGNAIANVAMGAKAANELGNVEMSLEGIGTSTSAGSKARAAGIGKNVAGEAGAGENIQAIGTRQDAAKIRAGGKDMDSLGKVSEVLGAISKAMTPEMMAKLASAAGEASGNMKIGAENMGTLNAATGKLSTSFDSLKGNIDKLNTSIINIGGFKTSDKANKPLMGSSGKSRADRRH